MKIDYPVYNGFIHYQAATSLRTPSLEEYIKEREAKSCPVSSVLPDVDSARSTIASLGDMCPSPPGLCQESDGDARINYHVKNTFIDYPAMRNPSLEEFLREREAMSCPVSSISDKQLEAYRSPGSSPGSTCASAEDMSYLPPPPGLPPFPATESQMHAGEQMQSPFVISLSEGLQLPAQLGEWSAGSVGHEMGCCKPCAFIWKDGCMSGAECPFCHLCPPGEIKKRKKDKAQFRKVSRVFRSHMLRYGSGMW